MFPHFRSVHIPNLLLGTFMSYFYERFCSDHGRGCTEHQADHEGGELEGS